MGGQKKIPANDIFCNNKTPSLLIVYVSQASKDNVCNFESCDLLQLRWLLSNLNYIYHVANVKKLMLRLAVLLCGSILENQLHHSGDRKYPRKLILIWYMGNSYGLMPFRRNFVDWVKCDIPVKNVNKINRVIGSGANLHKFINSNVKELLFPCVSYNHTQNDVQLFSPQNYHHMHSSYSEVHSLRVSNYLTGFWIDISIDM